MAKKNGKAVEGEEPESVDTIDNQGSDDASQIEDSAEASPAPETAAPETVSPAAKDLPANSFQHVINGIQGSADLSPTEYRQLLLSAFDKSKVPVLPPGFAESDDEIRVMIAKARLDYGNWHHGQHAHRTHPHE